MTGRVPDHPCHVCGASVAPFGVLSGYGISWACRKHVGTPKWSDGGRRPQEAGDLPGAARFDSAGQGVLL